LRSPDAAADGACTSGGGGREASAGDSGGGGCWTHRAAATFAVVFADFYADFSRPAAGVERLEAVAFLFVIILPALYR
jgi:hypothetical protein